MLEMVGIWFVCAWGSSSLRKSVAVKENEDCVRRGEDFRNLQSIIGEGNENTADVIVPRPLPSFALFVWLLIVYTRTPLRWLPANKSSRISY